jgi:hypothetical protein
MNRLWLLAFLILTPALHASVAYGMPQPILTATPSLIAPQTMSAIKLDSKFIMLRNIMYARIIKDRLKRHGDLAKVIRDTIKSVKGCTFLYIAVDSPDTCDYIFNFPDTGLVVVHLRDASSGKGWK